MEQHQIISRSPEQTQALGRRIGELAQPGDVIMGLSLASGGHLTHGAAPNMSGKWFKAVQYGVRREDAQIDLQMATGHAGGIVTQHRFNDNARIIVNNFGVGPVQLIGEMHRVGTAAGRREHFDVVAPGRTTPV